MPNPAYFRRRLCHRPASIPNVKLSVVSDAHRLPTHHRSIALPEGIAMKRLRRTFLHLAAGAAALPAVTCVVRAQTYPTRPVRLIVPFAAGAVNDITARLIGQWLSERFRQQFLIDNRPGGGGNIGI